MNDEADASKKPRTIAVGFDTATVEAWLLTVTELTLPMDWSQLHGGNSNLTYLLRDAQDRQFVIRRPPLGPLAPKAHDMAREYKIIEALWPTSVAVPRPIGYCDDPLVAEAHFYVMSRCAGEALYTQAATRDWLDPAARRHAADCFINVLAALHSIGPSDIGLGDLGRPDQYILRQINRWYQSWISQTEAAAHDDPRLHEIHETLLSRIPEQGVPRIVHGDYGPHNALFERSGEISAVLDWEMATLGDPLADFAYAANAWVGPGDVPADGSEAPTALVGFPTRQEIVDRYVGLTGSDVSQLPYYRVYNYWRRACILQGVYVRYLARQKSSTGIDLPNMLRRINGFLDAAESLAPAIG